MLMAILLPLIIMGILLAAVVPIMLRGKSIGEGGISIDALKITEAKASMYSREEAKSYVYDFSVEIAAEYTGRFKEGEDKIGIIPFVSVKGPAARAAIDGLSAEYNFFSVKPDSKKFSGVIRGSAKSKIPPAKEGFGGEIKEGESFLIKSSEGGTFMVRLEPVDSDIQTFCSDGLCTAVEFCENPEFFFECINFEDKFSLKPWKQCENSNRYEDCKKEYTNVCKGYFYIQMGSIDCENRKVTGLRIAASGGEDFKAKESLDVIFWKKTKCVEDRLKEGKYDLLQQECTGDLLASHTLAAD